MVSDSGDRGPLIITTSCIFLALAIICVFIRLAARLGYVKNAGGDDLAIVIALVGSIEALPARPESDLL